MREYMRKRVILGLMLTHIAGTAFAAGGGGHEETDPEAEQAQTLEFQITNKYKHQWLRFPDVSGRSLADGEPTVVQPKKGQAVVLFFLASWCLPCQKLAPTMQVIRKKYESQSARFIFVFAQDTLKDAQGFMKSHKLEGEAILADKASLKTFHEPELPSVYMGDRTNWLALRYIKVSRDQLKELNDILAEHTAY